jgi:hypothetical protein
MKSILIVILALAVIPINAAFAQESDFIIKSQIILRDSAGNLVAFLEVNKIAYVGAGIIHSFLDGEFNPNSDPILSSGEKNYQLIRRAIDYTPEADELLTDLTLNVNVDGRQHTIVRPVHDGIPVKKGDTLTVIWTFIRAM